MDFRISIVVKVLAITIALLTRQVSCQVNLTGNFNPQDSVINGTVVTLTCTVEDHNGLGATVITGSQAVFDCPSVNFLDSNKLTLRHSHMQSAQAFCTGELVSGKIVKVVQNGTYIAQISITTTIAMSGEYVECSDLGMSDHRQQIQLPNIIVLLGPLAVEFSSNDTFCIYWNQISQSTTLISHYFINVTGEDCGNCTNLGIVSSVTNQLSCTGWEPNGQVCNVTVTAVASVQQLYSSSLATVYLQTPTAPFLEELIPVYSYDREELQSMEIFLAVDSTVDLNDLPITFQVNVERSSQDDTPSNCSFNFSAKSKCITTYALKYGCGINFTIRHCLQLLLQQEQEAADYQIIFFAETSIGRSLSANYSVLAYANLAVRLLFEPQQAQKEFSYISIIFPQDLVYDEVTFMIKYGSNCQALDNQTTIVGFNVTTLTFSVSITDNICCIVSIIGNNAFEYLAIQGNFSNEGVSAHEHLIGIPVAFVIVLVIVVIVLVVVLLKICKESRSTSIRVTSTGTGDLNMTNLG